MARKLGTYPLSSNIEIEAGAPLDARTIVPLKADLTRAGSFSYPYVGMEVFVTEELQKYRLIGTNPELTDNWTKTDKGVVDGYYDAEHGGFYKDQGFTKPITGTSEVLYIDKSTDNVYRWNGSAFAQINPIDSQVPTIDMADERENIAQNDDVATIMGKIAKYFDDLGEVAFSDDYGDLDNTPTKLSEFENDPGYITDEGIVTSVKVGNTSYTPSDGVVSLPQYPDISGKADKATTLAGYGITDAKIANGTITLGANTITPLTQHQDISGKADKATTLAGYGITDAKIANGTITLGSNTITPVTDVSGKADKATTLAGYGITDAKIANGTITLGANTITPVTDVSGKADKSATVSTVTWSSNKLTKTINGTTTDVVTAGTILGNLTSTQVVSALGYTPYDNSNPSGYTSNIGTVTGVKMNGTTKSPTSGIVDLGTVITSHQDISGKADKATTLAGYGITDAKIASGTITLGSNTITPLTSHQSVTDNNPTLSWGTKSKVATIGSTAINVTMPSNPNTDTKVTSVGNHYAPAEDSTAQLDADASSSTAATWNSTSLVTGVTVKRDAKGHVTGLAVDSIKMPANPNTNTTYTFADGTNGFTVTPSGGTAQTVKVTPSITNNVTGSGTSGYLAKFNGANTITSGPQLGSGTTTYLRNDGSWATPTDTNTTYTIATGDSNGQIKVTPSSGSAYNVGVKGLGSSAYTTEDSISPYEANLRWGGKNFSGSYGPIDAALMDELGANRFQFIKASAITVEYSRDGGSTWTDYGASDAAKMQIFAQGGSFGIGKNDSSNKATANPGKYMLRITIDTGTAGIYTVLNKIVVYVSSGGSANCYCKIQKALQSTPTTFVDHTDNISISGWSGYNVINISGLTTYGNTASSQYGRVRFIFGDGSGGNTNYNGLNILKIKGFGGVGWETPSTMAKTSHLYNYDESQNATFPANVTATKFIGPVADSGDNTGTTFAYSKTDITYANLNSIAVWNNTGTGYEIRAISKNNFARATTTTNIGIDAPGHCAIAYVSGLTKMGWNFQQNDGALYTQYYNSSWIHEIFADYRTGQISLRGKNNGTWQDWRMVLDSSNYTNYTVKKDGTGASGSWGINVTGSAGSVAWANVSGRPTNVSSFTNDSGYITSSGSCASATKATQDGNGNTISTTYMKKGVDRVTAGQKSGTSLGVNATAEGSSTTASGRNSHAEGLSTVASEYYAHAEGYETTASGDASHAEGRSHETYPTIVTKATGMGSHAEGIGTLASGLASHAEGLAYYSASGSTLYSWTKTEAYGEGAHAEGVGTSSGGKGSHSEGYKTSASSAYSHAEGSETTTFSGSAAHAEGSGTYAYGTAAHAEGSGTYAYGDNSHSEGYYTRASSNYQHVEGKYNVEDSNNTYAHIIGGGSDENNRKNIFTVDWTGNTTIAGSLIVPGNDNYGILPASDDYGFVGSEDKRFYTMAATDIYARRTVYLGSESTYYGSSGSLVMCHKSSAYHSEMVPSNFTTSRTLTIPDETGTLATREYLVSKHYARVGSSTVSKTTDQYGQFSLSVSNGYIVACGVDYRYWVMRHGETSFRLMKQGSYAIQASTTVTVWYIYVTYSS